jgi:hypothetical protein
MKKLLTLLLLSPLAFADDIYLECEASGLAGHDTKWINNACQITQKNKQYFEITSKSWKHTFRKDTTGLSQHTKPNGEFQLCGSRVESFETLVKRAKETGRAITDDYYAGATRYEFFEEFDSDDVSSFDEKAVLFSENEITLKMLTGRNAPKKLQKVLEWKKINRLTGEVFDVVFGKNKVADCEPISKSKYNKVIKDWNDGYKKIQEAEQLKRKF